MVRFKSALSDMGGNFVKSIIALSLVEEGVEPLVKEGSLQYTEDIINQARQKAGLRGKDVCGHCTTHNAVPCKFGNGICHYGKHGNCRFHDKSDTLKAFKICPKDICNRIVRIIKSRHRFHSPNFKNTDARRWFQNPFEIMKCYISTDGYQDIETVEDTGCAGLLSVIINCKSFQSLVAADLGAPDNIFVKTRQARNMMFHSVGFTITDRDLQEYMKLMLSILNDAMFIAHDNDAKAAAEEIQEIADGYVHVFFGEEVQDPGLNPESDDSKDKVTIAEIGSSYVASDSFDGSGSRDTSFGSFIIYGGKVAISNMAMGSATQGIGFPSYNQLPTVKAGETDAAQSNVSSEDTLSTIPSQDECDDIFIQDNRLKTSADEPDAASSKVWLEDTLSSMSQLSSLAESLRNISRPDEINQIQANSMFKISLEMLNIVQQKYNKDNKISEWNAQINGKDFDTRQRESFQSSGHLFKKNKDGTLSERMVNALSEQMKSIGALITAGRIIGTVFRVGSKYVMTASHVVWMVIDPHNNGNPDIRLLESDDTFINFNESLVLCDVRYKVRKEFIENKELDIAVLEIDDATLSGLPMKMNLCVNDISEVMVTNVSLVGYGHPGNPNKHLDPKCEIIPPSSDRLQKAHCFYQTHLDFIRSEIQKNGGNPDIANKGYVGFDQPSKFLLDCFIEHGASGGPALTNDERSVQVVGFLTHGLPEFYFSLPDSIKGLFPKDFRLEVGTKMNHIFKWMEDTQDEEIVKDIFMTHH